MVFFEKACMELKRLQDENAALRKKMESAPDGVLRRKNSGEYYSWYHNTVDSHGNRTSTYINKKNTELAQKLAAKTYYDLRIKDNEKDIAALETFMRRCSDGARKSREYRNDPAFRALLHTRDIDKELAAWRKEEYEKCPSHPEALTIRAANGEMVRSKSEAFIMMMLENADIPYRYECKLTLDDETAFYPDFMIRRPKDGKLIIWEHFGLMSNWSYSKSALEKISRYISNGFYPMDNLITTFEGADKVLDMPYVMRIIEWLDE